MAENRTSKKFRSHFRFQSTQDRGGYVGKRIPLNNTPAEQRMNDESKIRYEMQAIIKKLVMQKTSVEEIKEILSRKKECKNYEQYIDDWIGWWVTSLNPQIKSILIKSVNRDREQEEIETQIKELDEEIYELYKWQIQKSIIERKETRKRKQESEEKER